MVERPSGAPHAPPMLRHDRLASRTLTGGHEPTRLNGPAVIAILKRRLWPLLASIILVPSLTLLALSQITPLYTATGTLLYDASEYKLRELQSILRTDPITDAVMTSQAEVLRGILTVAQVASRLNLYANPEFNAALRRASWPQRAFAVLLRWSSPRVPKHAVAPELAADAVGPQLDPARNATLQAVRAALVVAPIKSSHVLEVSFTAQDPVLAAAAVNHAMDAYVKGQLSAKQRAVRKAKDWLKVAESELRGTVQEKEDEIARYRARNGMVEGMHARLGAEQISLLNEDLAHSRNDLAAAEGRLDAAAGRSGAAAQAAISPAVVQLRARESQLTGQLQAMLGRLGAGHPDVQSLRAQLAETERSVAAEIARSVAATEADVRAGHERVAALEQDLLAAQRQAERDAEAQIPLNALQRDGEASRSLLQLVLERSRQTDQQAAIEGPDAHEISSALPPDRPSFPRTVPIMVAATASGVLFGLLLVYLLELADRTLRSGDDVRTALELPCFALIPRVPRRALGHSSIAEYAAREPLSPLAEQLRALRAGLSLRPDGPHIVAVTAALQAEGKTTVTLALGRLAAMNGERVIVLDCDIRRSSPSRISDADTGPGLVDCLQDRAPLADIIRRDRDTGMDYIPAGTGEANALGLLRSAMMARLLQTLRQDYDLVLLDTPPAQAVTDARIITGLADATLLCVRWRHTAREVVQNALELLEEAHANVVGAALTQVDVKVHARSGYADAVVYHPPHGSHLRG